MLVIQFNKGNLCDTLLNHVAHTEFANNLKPDKYTLAPVHQTNSQFGSRLTVLNNIDFQDICSINLLLSLPKQEKEAHRMISEPIYQCVIGYLKLLNVKNKIFFFKKR